MPAVASYAGAGGVWAACGIAPGVLAFATCAALGRLVAVGCPCADVRRLPVAPRRLELELPGCAALGLYVVGVRGCVNV